jgi:hypothetical protein
MNAVNHWKTLLTAISLPILSSIQGTPGLALVDE